MKKWTLSLRQRCDLELILNKGFAPLTGFLNQAEYENVLQNMRLGNGKLWPMPVTLDVDREFAASLDLNEEIALQDSDNVVLARMRVESKWKPDKSTEAQNVFGTYDVKHPAVNYLLHQSGEWYLGGTVEFLQLPHHYDFKGLRQTPANLQTLFQQLGWKKIIGFQTRNPIHRAHMEMTLRASAEVDGNILLHPVVGMTKTGDVNYFTRVRCYQKLLRHYPTGKVLLSLLPLAMRMGGPREALWHALIRKNYGCTHFIVGRDHAGPGNDTAGKPFYPIYAAQELAKAHEKELGLTILPFSEMVYVKERQHYCTIDEVKASDTVLTLSGTQLRQALTAQTSIPEWFSFPEIIKELENAYTPRHKQGFTIFFTGLSAAGKTTIAQALSAQLMTRGIKNHTLLDGDIIRQIFANDLGFSQAERELNIRRIGFMAAQITKVGGIAICAAIAPYEKGRHDNRELISEAGGYIEIYVATPLQVCEKRDPKGLYAKARKHEITNMTGIDGPYEVPETSEIVIDTALLPLDACVNKIISYLENAGYLAPLKEPVSYERNTST